MLLSTAALLLTASVAGAAPVKATERDLFYGDYPVSAPIVSSPNICEGAGDGLDTGLTTTPCSTITDPGSDSFGNGQTGGDVTCNKPGLLPSGDIVPITEPLGQVKTDNGAMCVINVHFHYGAEHNSDGEYDQLFTDDNGPNYDEYPLPDNYTGKRCNYYADPEKYGLSDNDFKPYNFENCVGLKVGETVEIHWPHSVFGACGQYNNQFQTPFNNGLLCTAPQELKDEPGQLIGTQDLASNVGVQAQVFTIVNNNRYSNPKLIDGMLVDEYSGKGQDLTAYTGSRTSASFDDTPDGMCDAVSPVSWHVDRKCHLISASSMDKLCLRIRESAGMRRCGIEEGGPCERIYNRDKKAVEEVKDPADVDYGKMCCFPDTLPTSSRGVNDPQLVNDNQVYVNCPSEEPSGPDCALIDKKKQCNKAEGCMWSGTGNDPDDYCMPDSGPGISNANALQNAEAPVEEEAPNAGWVATAKASGWTAVFMMTLWFN